MDATDGGDVISELLCWLLGSQGSNGSTLTLVFGGFAEDIYDETVIGIWVGT